nr:hypothetical protein [uncultured Holophaga sp.]
MALAKVVCNLRHYFRQDQESTVRLIQKHYNPKSDYQWSEEGIRLTWDRVAPFTPFLGFVDVDAQSKRRVADLEDDVIDLIAFTRSGGQASTKELFATFKAWHPDLEVDPRVFGKAVKAATGINTKSSNSERYYEGFHLPSPEELMDTAHTPGALQSEAVEVTAPIRERGAA